MLQQQSWVDTTETAGLQSPTYLLSDHLHRTFGNPWVSSTFKMYAESNICPPPCSQLLTPLSWMAMKATINSASIRSPLTPLQSIHKTVTIMIPWKQTLEHVTLLLQPPWCCSAQRKALGSMPHNTHPLLPLLPCCAWNTGPITHQASACLQVFVLALPSEIHLLPL